MPVRSTFLFLTAAALTLGAAGCSSTPTSPSTSAAFSQSDLRIGDGDVAATGKILTLNYTGWFWNPSKPDQKGQQFETSIGASPLTFTLGAGQVIAGMDRGAVGMQVGGLRRLIIPPSLAYGTSRRDVIPPYATLVFEIELLSVQ